jgi:rhodanese-related sulfurtransferase
VRYRSLDGEALAREAAGERPPVVLDIRDRAAFEAGHVPGSLHVPVHEMGRRRADLPRSLVARIVLVGEPGKRLEAGANWLVLMGYGDVAVLEGGIDGWPGEVETGPPEPPKPSGPELRIVP